MKRLIIFSGFIGFIVLLTGSCTKKISLEPISQISNSSFWKTENDARGALYGMYTRFRIPMASSYFMWGEARSEVMGDSYYSVAGFWDKFYYNNLNRNNVENTYPNISITWQPLFAVVHDANLLLKYVPTISFTSEDEKNRILAEAHTMRAFLYFIMARTWGDVPLVIEPTEGYDPASIQKERAPVGQVFDFIKEDLETALSLFRDNNFTDGRNRWSKSAANTLKADVYLWTGKRLNGGQSDFEAALTALNDAGTSDLELLDNFQDVFDYNNKGNKEIVMAVNFSEREETTATGYRFMYVDFLPSNVSQATIDAIGALSPNGGYWGPTALVRNQFTVDDQRRAASFYQIYTQDGNGDSTYYYSPQTKFKGIIVGGLRRNFDDVLVYRFADILLMKAEAKNALGQDPAVEINQIRQRAYGANFSTHEFINGSQEENDAAILKERLLELIFEGKRWWDLVRFNKAFELVPSLTTRTGQDYLLLFPISDRTLSLEPKITQNPGYN